MRQINFIPFFIVLVLTFCSCQKEIENYAAGTDSTSIPSGSFLVSTYSEDLYAVNAPNEHVKDSFKLSYDSKGRQISLVPLNSAGSGSKVLYNYSASNQITLDLYDDNQLSTHEIIYLNSYGYFDSTYQFSNDGDTLTEKYFYDTNRQLLQLNSYDYSSTTGAELSSIATYEYDSEGNKIKETEDGDVTTYTYANHVINNLDIGLNILKPSKYLPDTETHMMGSTTETVTHIYAFDNKNRLIMDKAELSNGYVAIKQYTY